MSKVEFANVPNGVVVQSVESHVRYRLHERIGRKLLLVRISPVASMPLVEIVSDAGRGDYNVLTGKEN